MEEPQEIIRKHCRAGIKARETFFNNSVNLLDEAAFAIALAIAKGGKLLICGNGGSAADAQHVAGEFINRFMLDRPALPALALTTDTSTLTAIGNDVSFERIFARQVEALGRPGDILIAISTSGKSQNVLLALEKAKARQLTTIGLCGENPGPMAGLCDFILSVPSSATPVIQEVHLTIEHLLCQLCDYYLFINPQKISMALANRSQ